MMISESPRVMLSNGLVVCNFSSPHPFKFRDGSILPACDPDRVKAGELHVTESVRPFKNQPDIEAITPRYELTEQVISELRRLEQDHSVHVVIVPFPVLDCLKRYNLLGDLQKVATIRIWDRQSKIAYINKFCR